MYSKGDNLIDEDKNRTEMEEIGKKTMYKKKYDSKIDINDMVYAQNILNNAIECSDHISRLAGICLSLNQDDGIEFEQEFSKSVNIPLPWDDEHYNQKSKIQIFTNKDFPDWLPRNDESINNFNF